MKQKQFFFALVAMLSFVFSGFAQTTVTTEAQLKAALESAQGGEITLAEDVTLKENIETGNGNYTLNLNNHQIKGDFSGYVLKVGGTLTIKGDGEITGKTTILYCKSGGTINIEGGAIHNNSNNNVIFTVGTLNVYGGSILSTASPNRAIEGAGSGKINLYGGTVTSLVVAKGALNIAGINVTVENGINVGKNAGNVNISAGTIKGDVTIADEAKSKVTISGGSFEYTEAIKDCMEDGSALLQKPDGTYEIVAGLLKIGDTYYPTLDAAFKAAADGATIELINQEGAVIAMNGSLYGKNVTITGTAKVDWNKGFLFVGRGGEGNATLTFDNANLTSASNSSSYGIHVSGREKDTNNKYDGTLVIKNSTIELDYLINKGAMTLDNSTLTVKNGFDLNGRPASETENGEDANATLALTNNSKLVVNNHNGMGIGREGKGELTVDASSTFEHTLDFLVCANGTMDVKGTLVSNGKKLTNNGEVKFTATKLTDATIEGTGTTRFYNDVNFYGANSITTGINGTPFHLVINKGANLFITRFVLGYDRNITVNGTIADASAFNPAGQTPSLKFNSTSGVSVGGTGTGNLTVNNAYIELGNSSWKNAQGTYDWDFVNSYVSAVSFTNATGADAATWDVTFDKSVLDAKNYIKNGNNVTYHFTNNSRGTTGSLRIDGVLNIDATSSVVTTSQQNNKVGAVDEHGGINGTVNVEGNLTIGSNAKTQLEVLGGTVNVVEGATLALGNNTLTLDAASALQSAGNISGAITAANGANVAITGGTYTQDVSNWCTDGFMTQQNADGSFGIAKAAAKVGDKKYASLETAFKAATSGCTIEIVSDVTVDYNWDARYTGGKFTVPVTINGNGKTIKFTASVNDNNYQAPFRFEADATVKNLTIDMSEVTDNRFRAISSKGNLTVDGCKFIGKDESLNCRAIIFGEGAGANVGNLAISITNSEFINWKRGITDNENAQDVKTVTITGNKMTDAGVGVSAKETVTFTGNTVAGAYVNIKSYTAGNKLAVTATGNTLEANTDAAYNVIDAGGVVNAEGFKVVAKGNNFNGYTNTDGIWGETWGNAKESFVVKVLDANGNVMGTTSLNNIGGIINGNVNVSWNLKFNAAANTDEYWTMAWTTAPSISNMPARVALWVDGVEVSGGPVVLNGPDDLNKIVAAVTDADGKIISCHTSVANAAATNATNIALLRETTEEISLPVGTILNKNGFNADKVTVKQPVVQIGDKQYATFAEALNAVENGQTITLIQGVTGDEKSTELTFEKDIKFTITGKAPQYALPIVTFQNAEVTIKDAEILIPELDARQNAVINIVNSTVHDAGGNSIAKSYYNGTINIDETSTVYMMQITTMGYINVAGTVNASWQTNVYGNGIIALAKDAKFNTGALHLTGKDYSGRDNTDTDRVGKPATIVVDGATLNVGSVKSDNGSDYSYNSKEGINVGTIDGKLALLDVKNGGAVNFHMANGQTTNFGAGATVNVAASTLKTICRDANGTVKLDNKGIVNVTGASQLDVKNFTGNAINATNATLADVQFGGAVNAFGVNNISGTSTIGGILGLGYGTNPNEQVVVNITGNFNGTNVLVSTNNGVDNILNVGKADGERTTVHFGQLGAFADVNVVNADVTYGYAFIRNDFNALNSTFAIKGGANTYFSGNAKVVLDNTTWALPGYANIGSYGGYMYGNADVTLKNGSSMTATNLGVEVSGEKVVKLTLEDNSSLTATKLTNQGSIVLASVTASLNSNECANVTTSVPNQVVSYIDGKYTLVAAIAQIGGTAYTSIDEAFAKATEGQTITLVNDATPVLTSQRAITKAAVIDLNSKTMTLTEDDLYFGTTTFKNGTIVVDPSVKPSTAVFWMFANQTLTFDNVKIVATGVTGTYLIGLDGNNSDLNLLNGSEILVENTTALDLDIICVNASTGNDIKVENSKVNVTNLDGKVFFRGNYTVKDSEVNLAGITKAGFRIEAGQTLSIEGTSKVNIEGEPRDGGINLIGTASYTKAETATVNATVTETGFEAKIGDVKYTTFNEAVAAAQDGAEVTIHKAGTYNVPSGKNLTITGAVDGVKFANIGAHNMGGASMTFNNVTFEYGNENYMGLQHSGNLVYNNCTFDGQVFLYGQSETFNKCTFNQTSADAYNVWTYGAKEVAFNECTFNSAGKSVLIYHENANMFNDVAVTNSTFNASQAVEGKAAIEMDASLTAGINLTIDAATTATGFGAGNVSGNSLWNNKKGNADEANNDITVKVGDETVLAPVYEAKIGEKNYRNLQDAVNAVKDGETITLIDNVEATEVILLDKSLTINGNGYKVTSNATRVFRVTVKDTEVTLNDVNMVSTAKVVYPGDIRGISIDDVTGVKLTLNNCSVDFTDASAHDWSYAVNVVGGSGHVVTVNGGTYEGANVINVRGTSQTVSVEGATLTSLYANNDQYYGACIYVVQDKNTTVTATGNTFNGDNAFAFNVGYTPVTESNNTDNTKYVVAKIGDAYYTSIQDAVEAAQNGETIKLTQNVTIDELVKLEKAITLDLNYKKVTSTAMKAFEVYAKATIKNGTIEAVQRCVDTRKAVELTLTDVTLNADKYTSYGNPQPLTIGGYENGTKVTMTKVNINAADGYGIITFVKTELTATNSTIAGYSALYVKPGSDNSVFNFTESALSGSNAGNDVEGNSFSTIAVRANNVTVNVDAASTVTAVGNYCDAMSFGGNYAGEESVTDANVTIAGTINGNIMFAGLALNNNVISVKAEYADELATAGFVTSEADATGLVTIKDVTVLNEMTIEHSAYAGLEFVNENEKEVGTLKYVRNFSNTNWRALYVPFAINYDDIKDDFEVRRLEMAHEIEKTDGSVEIKFDFMTIKDGQTLKANYPYLIKPKQAGEYTITVKNTTLKKTVSRSIDCSTVDHKFIFTGIYETVSGQEMVVNKYYAMNANQLQYATDPDYHALNPFNWYMKIEGREDLSDVKFVFGGDFEDEETTGITNIDNDQKNDDNIYDLQGRRVLHPQKGSLYIVNGKKVVY